MKHVTRLLPLVLLLACAAIAVSSPGGPVASMTGAPGEGTCADCHGGGDPNTNGAISFLDAPDYFRPGRTYTIRVRLASAQTAAAAGRVWGFQLTAIHPDGSGAGTFAPIAGQGTQTISGEGPLASRVYLEQTSQGLRDGASSPVEWSFDWTAPPAGAVTFYAAGLAADGDGTESSDWTYVGSFAAQDTTTPAAPTSWGRVKSVYR